MIPNLAPGMTDILNLNSPVATILSPGGGMPTTQAELIAQLNDPNSWISQRIAAAERAAADQNQFNRGISQGGLDVQRQNANTDRAYREALVKQAADDLAFKYAQLGQDSTFKQGQLGLDTLKLGASLTGPRRWDQYLETAAQAGQNPILNQAMNTWSSLTGGRPNTGAVSGPLPQRFDLNALFSDFGGGGGQGGQLSRDENLDRVAMQPGFAAPGWWQGLSGDEQERAKGYWETRGWSPSSVLNSLSYTAPVQGLGYGGI